MSQVIHMTSCKVKPGRLDDAVALWKNIKKGADVNFNVAACSTGGPYTDTFLVSMVYPSGKAMVEAFDSHAEQVGKLYRDMHSADSPFEPNFEASNWSMLDLD